MNKNLDYIKKKLSLLPMSPGCYLMKNTDGKVIYVGKARKLKNRVSSYFTGAHNYKTTKLVDHIWDFDYIVTGSEKEALLLEINLIKDYTPEYNIMFMDNTYYPYIELTDETHPRLKIVRKTKNKKNKYFGPYPDATAARNTFKLLNKLYPLRKCNHVPDKPCLYYSLHQCLGPCINEVDKSQYDEIRKELISFIHGNTKSKIDELTEKMMTASENLQFELAKEYRDLIRSIEYVTAKQNVQFGDYKDRDILGYFIDKGYISIQLFFMREGKLLYHDFNLEPVGEDFEEDLIRFLVTYYQTHPEPYELLIPQDVDLELLTEILSCHVLQPQRGDKKSLVEMANKNAKEALEKKFLLKEKTDEKTILPIIELGQKLGIDTPHTIELYDNSNIQGAYAVAGMVVYKDGVPSKKDYRKYKIKTVEGPDDYASMKEVIYRRYYRLLMEQKEMADLIIVDGGLGQIKVAKEVIDSLNLSVHICGLSKDDKHSTAMLLDEDGNQVPIDTKSPLFFLLTRMQDEVHRYAISFHRQVRSKSLFSSILDEVEGIGEARKKKLLNHFKSVKKMKEASLEELEAVIPKNTAAKLYEVLHKE
ncbi:MULTISPECIES: excinuclease ABC subunit UvrC [Coprobacillaceae]|uniref:UvrABC system protein C n=9 Tax=Catenibacterium TaxID=135858 RepID=A0AAW4MVN4_9FIRM|nr:MULTISPECIES: excinuclease ABC subunit UvrC [Coprobacillaceae]MBU9056149.1 excinuclease ABC subunit UvrC [Catenibacterium mitsuokai]MBV3367343.1 excinuclease ABC subunit UvrC [Catenibacterium mitsuokai]MBV3371448.1 excinuclease ABC subunit UvrC [Catenibacterium mitsuokai]MBV3376747.1 excinuclease ABC subunit UvrC [Catenibacterium mitsuokai]MBV3378556.1 excinuclease ABC subunit UvrC [Catenibacterium mitsuokai]